MMISTAETLMKDQAKVVNTLANFWDKISSPFDETWGPHIHHGYFEENAYISLFEAQELLIYKLIDFVDVVKCERVLDAGCGMGVTSIYLAQRLKARISGVTLSPKQVTIAQKKAGSQGVSDVDFRVEDVHSLKSFKDETFDVVWSLESCEQFYDKPLFLRQAYRVLKPGGKLMLATWCSGKEEYIARDADKYKNICIALDLPYMPTISYYSKTLKQVGFDILKEEDWSEKVAKTWSIAPKDFQKKIWSYLLKAGFRGFKFVQDFKLMEQGYKEKMVRYGVFVAKKP